MNSDVKGGKALPPAFFRRDVAARTAGAVSASKGGYAIADTSTTAKVGDLYRAVTATTAGMVLKEYPVIEASTNSFTIASKDLPTLGDTFFILGPTSLRVDDTGAIASSVAGGATEAKQDTMITHLSQIEAAVETLDNAISGNEMQVDIVAALPAGNNNIGDVDIASSVLPTGAATSAKQDEHGVLLTSIESTNYELFATTGTGGAAVPTKIIQVGGSDGTNLRALKTDADGELQIDVLSLPAIPAGNNNIGDVDVASLPTLPAGDNNIGNVDLASAIPAGSNSIGYVNPNVTATGSITTQNLVPAGTATANSAVELSLDSGLQSVAVQVTGTYTGALSAQYTVGSTNVWVTMSSTNFVTLADGLYNSGISSAATGIYLIPANGATKVRITGLAAMTGTAVVTMTGSQAAVPGINGSKFPRVDLASVAQNSIATANGTAGSSTIRTSIGGVTTATVAAVADSDSNVTLLASSGTRAGATFFNDSPGPLYLKFGTTATTTTSFTVKIAPGGFYELPGPHIYTGNIDGIWTSSASGNCLVTSW